MGEQSGGLAREEPGHGVDEILDREGFVEHRVRAEPIDLLHRLLVRRAHDDRCHRKALLDPTYERECETAVVSMKTGEIGDDKIGTRVGSRVLKTFDDDHLITLIAQHVAKEVSDRTVVFNDQYLSYVREAGGLLPDEQL